MSNFQNIVITELSIFLLAAESIIGHKRGTAQASSMLGKVGCFSLDTIIVMRYIERQIDLPATVLLPDARRKD